MLDSSGGIPNGLLQGNMMDLGFFDECITISETVSGELIKGKYCYSGLYIPFFLLNQTDTEINKLNLDRRDILVNIERLPKNY